MKCPRCGSTDLRWSESRFWEIPLGFLGFQMFRCRRCRCREFLFPGSFQFRVTLKLDLPKFAARVPIALITPGGRAEANQSKILAHRPPGPVRFSKPPEVRLLGDGSGALIQIDGGNLERLLGLATPPRSFAESSPETIAHR